MLIRKENAHKIIETLKHAVDIVGELGGVRKEGCWNQRKNMGITDRTHDIWPEETAFVG